MYANRQVLSKKLRDMPVGDTADGAAWCIKALHPADHEVVPRGMPTHDATSVVNLQYQREFQLMPPAELTSDTWDIDFWFVRDPVLFGCYQAAGTDGSALQVGTILNGQLGASHADAVHNLMETCEAYRVSYMGVTGHLVAPALADQGTVRAAQYEFPAFVRPYVPASASNLMTMDVVTYPDKLIPYAGLIQMPNAYQNDAREGFYVPMKLVESDKEFIKTNQLKMLYGQNSTNGRQNQTEYAPGRRWPWYDTSEGVVLGFKPGDLISHVAFRGIAKSASVNLIIRCGLDMKVRPETTYSPFNHEPPVYDATAIKMYFEIARRMADGYPASYNSTGHLFSVISGIAQTLWPLVEPKARELLDKLTAKINQKVQQIANRNKLPKKEPEVKAVVPKKKPLPPKPVKGN